MAETMIERCARAMYHATPRNKPFEQLSAYKRGEIVLQVRAVLGQLREPTETMTSAGNRARMNIQGGYGGPGYWEAAIDAALSEGGE